MAFATEEIGAEDAAVIAEARQGIVDDISRFILRQGARLLEIRSFC
jgi:hypothetical protein